MPFPLSVRKLTMPQGMPAMKSLSEPAARVRRSLEGLKPSLAIKRFDTASLALPKADTGILLSPLQNTALATPNVRSPEIPAPDAAATSMGNTPASSADSLLPQFPNRDGKPSPSNRRPAGRDDSRAKLPSEQPDPVTLAEILGNLDHGAQSVTGRLTSGSGNTFSESFPENQSASNSRLNSRFQIRRAASETKAWKTPFAAVQAQLSSWLDVAASGWKYSDSHSFWSKASERNPLGESGVAESADGTGKNSSGWGLNPSTRDKNPNVEIARLIDTQASLGFQSLAPRLQASTENPFADKALRPSVDSKQVATDGQFGNRVPSAPSPSGTTTGLPAAWQRALAAFPSEPPKTETTKPSPVSSPSETTAPASQATDSAPSPPARQSPVPNPGMAVSPLEAARRLREGLPENPGLRASNAEVNWFAEEELADQLSRILGRQARRRGIDLS